MFKNKNFVFPAIAVAIYLILFAISFNFCYFWDVIQQVSNEGYWFYKTDFSSLLIPPHNELNVMAVGYHPPVMGIVTAALWKLLGYHLWVSHALSLFFALLLIYHTWRLTAQFIAERWRGWAFLLLLTESAVLTQFVIASPDFIMLAGFVVALRSILERRRWLLVVSLFLIAVNMRGVFTVALLFLTNVYFDYRQNKNYGFRSFFSTLLPYLPVGLLLLGYYAYYFANVGWFFTDSPYSEHYIFPESFSFLIHHLLSFGLRLLENGRFVVWILAIYVGIVWLKNRTRWTANERLLGVFITLFIALYGLFIFITQMPFSTRYFMPLFFALTLLTLHFLIKMWNDKKLKITFIVLFFFSLTGHFWIYPERMAKSWESTLMHISYYELRRECFDYIDKNRMDYDNLAATVFCLSGDRGRVELANEGRTIQEDAGDVSYLVYSNISNMPTEAIEQLHDTTLWKPLKHFEQSVVFITILERVKPNY